MEFCVLAAAREQDSYGYWILFPVFQKEQEGRRDDEENIFEETEMRAVKDETIGAVKMHRRYLLVSRVIFGAFPVQEGGF